MAEGRESSVLFSLKSLMDIESDRVQAEERARNAREKAERAAQERQRQLELEAERQRIILEEQRRAREQAARDEAAAREAIIREAAITRARIEAQALAQREATEREREHEARMAAIREVHRRRRDRVLWIGSNGVLAAILAVGLGVYFGKVGPDTAQREAQLNRLISAEGERADTAERLARQSEEKVSTLETRLARTQSELREARDRLARPSAVPPTQRRRGSHGGPQPTPAAAPTPCSDGDPLCPNLTLPR